MTRDEVLAELEINLPIEVAWTSKDGTLRADDGDSIDERQTEEYVWALGPFGSWPETLDSAKKTIAEHESWTEGRSIRVGRCATWEQGWGYALRKVVASRIHDLEDEAPDPSGEERMAGEFEPTEDDR